MDESAAIEIGRLIGTMCGNDGAPTEAPPIETFESMIDETLLGSTPDHISILTCVIEISQNVTTEFELVTIWEQYEARFLTHLANLTDCPTAGDADAVQRCFDRESQRAIVTYREFLGVVREVSTRSE